MLTEGIALPEQDATIQAPDVAVRDGCGVDALGYVIAAREDIGGADWEVGGAASGGAVDGVEAAVAGVAGERRA